MKEKIIYMALRPLLMLLLFLTSLSACKKTVRDIAHNAEMGPRIESFIEEMALISEAFPVKSLPLKSGSLEALHFWDASNCNALLIDKMQLAFVDSDWGFSKEEYFEVGVGYQLANFISDSYSGQDEAPENYEQQWEDLLGLRFVVVVDTLYNNPVFKSDKRNDSKKSWEAFRSSFTGGDASATVAIYDREEKGWVGSFACEAGPPEKVEFKSDEEWKAARDRPYYVRLVTENRIKQKIMEQLHLFAESAIESDK